MLSIGKPRESLSTRKPWPKQFASGRLSYCHRLSLAAVAICGFSQSLMAQTALDGADLNTLKMRKAELTAKAAAAAVDAEIAAADAALVDAQIRVYEAHAKANSSSTLVQEAKPATMKSVVSNSAVSKDKGDSSLLQSLNTVTSVTSTNTKSLARANPDSEHKVDDGKGPLGDITSHLGAGIAVFLLHKPHIETATLTNNKTVVVTSQTNTRVSPWLEAHYTFDKYCLASWVRSGVVCSKEGYVYPGFFVGLGQGANGDFGSTFGAGVQLVFRRTAMHESLNLGLGYFRTKYRSLADGIEANKPLPDSFATIEYKDHNTGGVMFNLSFGFQ